MRIIKCIVLHITHWYTTLHIHTTQQASKAQPSATASGCSYPVKQYWDICVLPRCFKSAPANPALARLVTHGKLYHVLQVKVWAPKVFTCFAIHGQLAFASPVYTWCTLHIHARACIHHVCALLGMHEYIAQFVSPSPNTG